MVLNLPDTLSPQVSWQRGVVVARGQRGGREHTGEGRSRWPDPIPHFPKLSPLWHRPAKCLLYTSKMKETGSAAYWSSFLKTWNRKGVFLCYAILPWKAICAEFLVVPSHLNFFQITPRVSCSNLTLWPYVAKMQIILPTMQQKKPTFAKQDEMQKCFLHVCVLIKVLLLWPVPL